MSAEIDEEKDKLFLAPERGLEHDEVKKFKNIVEKNMVVGIEFEREFKNGRPRRSRLRRLLNTSQSYDRVNDYGVQGISQDYSLNNGWEIRLMGLNEPFSIQLERIQQIEKVLRDEGDKYSGNAGNHISVLTLQDYKFPRTIISNVWNLTRAFSGALYWLSSGHYEDEVSGTIKEQLIRPGAEEYASARLVDSPVHSHVKTFTGDKRVQCSMRKIDWTSEDEARGFFAEFRGVDCIRVPEVNTALTYLYKALVYKAVEFSEFGIASVEQLTDWETNKQATKRLLRGEQTSEDIDFFKQQAHKLVDLLTPSLKALDGESIQILHKLAEKPTSVRLRETSGDIEQIQSDLGYKKVKEKKTQKRIRQLLILQAVRGEKHTIEDDNGNEKTVTAKKDWKQQVADALDITQRSVEYHLTQIKENVKNIEWDDNIGTYVIVE